MVKAYSLNLPGLKVIIDLKTIVIDKYIAVLLHLLVVVIGTLRCFTL